MRESPRKHSIAEMNKKNKQPEKVIDLEVEEGVEDIDAEGTDPITKFPEFITQHKGKAKVTKDP